MLRHVVVAQDIALTVAEVASEARVLTAATTEEALRRLSDVERLAVAFVAEAPRDWPESPLAAAVAARGGRVVLIGEAAEAEGQRLGYDVLMRPFSTADVLACLAPR